MLPDRRCLDAGASTGGFTEVLLSRGAREVLAVDVGYGQLAWSLQSDERVLVYDRTNVRELTTDTLGGAVEVAVSDLSFISLTVVLPALAGVCEQGGDMVLMVKPQFEVGRANLGKNGVVRDPVLHANAVHDVCTQGLRVGLGNPRARRRARCLARPATSSTFAGCVRTLTSQTSARPKLRSPPAH